MPNPFRFSFGDIDWADDPGLPSSLFKPAKPSPFRSLFTPTLPSRPFAPPSTPPRALTFPQLEPDQIEPFAPPSFMPAARSPFASLFSPQPQAPPDPFQVTFQPLERRVRAGIQHAPFPVPRATPPQAIRFSVTDIDDQILGASRRAADDLRRREQEPLQLGFAESVTVKPSVKKDANDGAFRQWYATAVKQFGLNPNPDSDDQFYDYRAAFKAGAWPDASGHWPSQFKKAGHENLVVGGFNTKTGERVPGTKQASEAELVRLGWDPQTAARLSRQPAFGNVQAGASTTAPIRFSANEIEPMASHAPTAPFTPTAIRPMPSHGPTSPPAAPTLTPIRPMPSHRPVFDGVSAGASTTAPTDADAFVLKRSPLIDIPRITIEGVKQVGRGLEQLGPYAAQRQTSPVSQQLGAASDIIEGAFKAATPLLPLGIVAAPVKTALRVGAAMLADKAGQHAARGLGASDEAARLAGNLAAALVGVGGVGRVTEAAKAASRKIVGAPLPPETGRALDVLGIDRVTAQSPEALKTVYRQRAMATHPDRNPSSEAAAEFRAVKDAYNWLAENPPPEAGALEKWKTTLFKGLEKWLDPRTPEVTKAPPVEPESPTARGLRLPAEEGPLATKPTSVAPPAAAFAPPTLPSSVQPPPAGRGPMVGEAPIAPVPPVPITPVTAAPLPSSKTSTGTVGVLRALSQRAREVNYPAGAADLEAMVARAESGQPIGDSRTGLGLPVRGLENQEFLWWPAHTKEPVALVRITENNDAQQEGRYYKAQVVQQLPGWGSDPVMESLASNRFNNGTISVSLPVDWSYLRLPDATSDAVITVPAERATQTAPITLSPDEIASQKAPARPAPFEVLREALPRLGFTLSTDANEIWNRVYDRKALELKRTPTRREMRAVVAQWIEKTSARNREEIAQRQTPAAPTTGAPETTEAPQAAPITFTIPPRPISDRDALIERIVAAARNPDPEIVPSVELKGTDGKWYNPVWFPRNVNSTGERRIVGYVIRTPQGTTVGGRQPTAEAVLERWRAVENKKAEDFRADLQNMPETRLQSQRAYWLKETVAGTPLPTPTFEAPFSLTPEATTTTADRPPVFGAGPIATDKGKTAQYPLGAAPPSPVSARGRPPGPQLRPDAIIAKLSTLLNRIPIATGRIRARARGIYKQHEQVIRTRVANDLPIIAHEVGHHLDAMLLGPSTVMQPWTAELVALGQRTAGPKATTVARRQEGVAEFVRLWLSDPTEAQQQAPQYYAAFEAALTQQPDLGAGLRDIQRQMVGFLSADPAERGLLRIDYDGPDPSQDKPLLAQFEDKWLDDLGPIRRAVADMNAGTPPELILEDGFRLAHLARGSADKAHGFLQFGVRLPDGAQLSEGLEAALAPVRRRAREFDAYLVASHVVADAESMAARAINPGMPLDEAEAILAQHDSPEFQTARAAVHAYLGALRDYAVNGRVLSAEAAKKMVAAYTMYVPLRRVQDAVGAHVEGGAAKRIASRFSPFKRRRGSGRTIISPLESIVRNTFAIVDTVEKNQAMLALVDQAARTPGSGKYLEPMPQPMQATMVNLDQARSEIRGALQDAGIDVPDNLTFDQLVTVFAPVQFMRGDKGIVSVLRDGKREWFIVHDTALYDAMTAIGTKAPEVIAALFMKPARLLRATATSTLGFIGRNPVRDTFEAAVLSRHGFRLGYDTLRGLFEFLRRGEDYQLFLNSKAGGAALVSLDRDHLRESLRSLGIEHKQRLIRDIVLRPVDLLLALKEATETATRLGEFMLAVEQEGRTPEGYARAALAAKEVTVNFSRGGTYAKEINRYTAFFNAGVQGHDRIRQEFQRDPLGMTWRATTAITLVSLALWWINHDDQEYQEIPAWERNAYWHLPLSVGAYVPGMPTPRRHGFARIPKPWTLGEIFGNVPEAAMSFVVDRDPSAKRRLFPDANSAWDVVLAVMPTAVMPLVQVAANYDFFRHRAIVNPYDLGLEPELQYNRWTSETAIRLGHYLHLSPAKIESMIYGYTAGVGRGTLQAVDVVTPSQRASRPEQGPAQWPGVGAFYREGPSGASAESVSEFYDMRDQIRGIKSSLKTYREAGDRQAERALAQRSQPVLRRERQIDAADGEIADVRKQIEKVFRDRTMPPDVKRQRLDRLYERIVDSARGALGRPSIYKRAAGQ